MNIKMFTELRRKMEEHSENFIKEKIQKEKIEVDNTITELRNNSEGIKSRLANIEEWISGLEDRIVEIIQLEQHKEKLLKKII